LKDRLQPPFYIEYAAKTAKAEAEEEAEEAASEEGVAADASAPGTAAEAKPAKRGGRIAHDPVEKKTAREVFEYVIEQGKKEYQVQRYKGLGEMTAPQLWETTMDPARRTLLQVRLEDIAACEEIFTTLMGEDVESRRKFIEENALDVKNLDI
jgi:DNA gyrase subunit B